MNNYEQYIALSRYARYIPEENRRETWGESVDRLVNYLRDKFPQPEIPWDDLHDAMVHREVMPSMRALMTAGEALDRDNVAAYNCSYVPIDHPRAFDEIMYILMCGTGVGFSVERQYIGRLPEVAESFHNTDTTIRVADSKIGWAKASRELLALLWQGQVPKWDLSAIRPSGSRLLTFGGRASGPEPLEDFFNFAVRTFRNAHGRKLNSLECHDLVCKIGDIVVCGGVRRSALISLSNLTDERMRHAKTGDWRMQNAHRQLANNSVCYTEKPDVGIFLREWEALYSSFSGERGIFSRQAAEAQVLRNGRREGGYEWGTNPCSEIILRPAQFCNLSEVCVRSGDSQKNLVDKAKLASILGTLQSNVSNFRYLTSRWKKNTEEERLLGVSLTGIMDHAGLAECSDSTAKLLRKMRDATITTNQVFAKALQIQPSAAITCVKPSGTVSQLSNTSSGIHPRFSDFYIRRVRSDTKDPLTHWMQEKGIPNEPDHSNSSALVFAFPIKSPPESVSSSDRTAIQMLETVRFYNEHWCEHKASVTINVKEDEWLDVGAWVYKEFHSISGVSFLPYDGGNYRQMPYERITEAEYTKLEKEMPDVSFEEYREEVDNTSASQELACTAGACEI